MHNKMTVCESRNNNYELSERESYSNVIQEEEKHNQKESEGNSNCNRTDTNNDANKIVNLKKIPIESKEVTEIKH